MNITLSAREDVIERTREYAREHGTSLNQLIRDFLGELVGGRSRDSVADEFARNAMERGGRSPAGYRFNRDEAQRGQRRA